ncbi:MULTISPECIES: hypothetical protein [Methylobacterium]|uniref:DUF2829 domain-containing protein n=2 Tax=Methylobacterium TaxID=407 RepID=A0A0C6FST2_9HYPH|nr:hypothetical protein [Methylobacterium aquaticum]QRE77197.1 hypothetical protein F1D61_29925 [Methylobacterium aquaticum]BAQ45925.1 hypothetical protein Maq22A_c13560 [Methylobacterium aquaticum]
MDRVTCETCGEDTWSDRHPCSNYDTCPPTSNWSAGFRFDQALRGMRLGKRVQRPGWFHSWSIEDGKLTVRWPFDDEGFSTSEPRDLNPADILADDWEVA